MLFILLVFGACEARVGLALVTKMVRFVGSDKVSALVVNKISCRIAGFGPVLGFRPLQGDSFV